MQIGKLKLVSAVRRRKTVADMRREKLLGKLDEQIELATAQVEGKTFEAKRAKIVVDADGRRGRELVPARVKQWWWKASDGKLLFTIQYGTKALELAKGKSAIEVATLQELVEALQSVRAAAEAGELDAHIEAVSASLGAAFKRKTAKTSSRPH
ncbi:DUF6641 family protein [Leptothrix discophora]|uniref:Uncharacterized protein n=1 Tax=Leptothrix discophora TaxID=89 RepID=A0ABT9FZQ2_LEPDI|nr:DUF6641 family protein [Leptothrix discophora]MDP4299705.1 hypothetical protein [Leptothrix discophora]